MSAFHFLFLSYVLYPTEFRFCLQMLILLKSKVFACISNGTLREFACHACLYNVPPKESILFL